MYVYDFDVFLTVQIVVDTSSVLSFGKRCEDHGYSYDWSGGQKKHICRKQQENTMQQRELRTYRCSRLVNRTFQLGYECILNIGIAGHSA